MVIMNIHLELWNMRGFLVASVAVVLLLLEHLLASVHKGLIWFEHISIVSCSHIWRSR